MPVVRLTLKKLGYNNNILGVKDESGHGIHGLIIDDKTFGVLFQAPTSRFYTGGRDECEVRVTVEPVEARVKEG